MTPGTQITGRLSAVEIEDIEGLHERLAHDVWASSLELRKLSPAEFGASEALLIRQAAGWLAEIDAELTRKRRAEERLRHQESVYR